MTFKAQLFALIDAASSFSVGPYDVEGSFEYKEVSQPESKDLVRYCEIDLDEYDEGRIKFFDQFVEVNLCGACIAVCVEGKLRRFEFLTTRPITKEDLA